MFNLEKETRRIFYIPGTQTFSNAACVGLDVIANIIRSQNPTISKSLYNV